MIQYSADVRVIVTGHGTGLYMYVYIYVFVCACEFGRSHRELIDDIVQMCMFIVMGHDTV